MEELAPAVPLPPAAEVQAVSARNRGRSRAAQSPRFLMVVIIVIHLAVDKFNISVGGGLRRPIQCFRIALDKTKPVPRTIDWLGLLSL